MSLIGAYIQMHAASGTITAENKTTVLMIVERETWTRATSLLLYT